MTKDQRKAKVTPEHIEEARRLKAIWMSTEGKPNQAVFGETYEVGSQSAVTQFLNGDTPLSLKAAAGFASGLACKISDFSERLAKQALAYGELSGVTADSRPSAVENEFERQLLLFFRQLPEDKKDMLIAMANGWANMAHPETAKAHTADPFRNAPPPGAAERKPKSKTSAKGKASIRV